MPAASGSGSAQRPGRSPSLRARVAAAGSRCPASHPGSLPAGTHLITLAPLPPPPLPTVSSLSRDSFSREEVEDYFNYMGMLAAEVRGVVVVVVVMIMGGCRQQGAAVVPL